LGDERRERAIARYPSARSVGLSALLLKILFLDVIALDLAAAGVKIARISKFARF